ncbi:response regulator [Aeromonas sp. R7-5]|uniref:response regulator n=1 Tax=Aeromonas sp. R7-5 TaxID=3138477 RepID=UPI0034A469FD
MKKLKIMTLDDHALILRGLNDILLTDQSLIMEGSFTTSKTLITALQNKSTDVVIMDFSLSPDEMDGLSLIKYLTNKNPATALLVVSAHYNCGLVIQALRAGAKGFIGKNSDPKEITKAVHCVAKGNIYLSPEMKAEIESIEMELPHKPYTNSTQNRYINRLSPKEHEVVRCIIEGMSVSEIAQKFHRSIKTISSQKQSALRKLGIKNDHELFLIREEIR